MSGNALPNTPDIHLHRRRAGRAPLTDRSRVYGRGEMAAYGAFFYDDLNRASQDAYSLANFRAGAREPRLFAESWIKNAFDTHYIPLAFPYLDAVGVHWRERPTADARRQCRSDVLSNPVSFQFPVPVQRALC